MKKDVERKLARVYFVKEGLTAKEAAEKVNVSEATAGRWRVEDKWDDLRMAELTSDDTLINDLKSEINNFIEQRQKNEISASKAADGISKLQKVIETLQKRKVTVEQYIHVMDSIFRAVQRDYPDQHASLLDFQDNHIVEIAKQLG